MKIKALFTLVILLLACHAQAAPLVLSDNGSYVAYPAYTLQGIAGASFAAGRSVHVTSQLTVAASMTWPADRELVVEKGGSIYVNSGQTFTINGPFKGIKGCFKGPGTVKLAPTAPLTETSADWWWDGTSDPAIAINKAILGFDGSTGTVGRVKLESPVYNPQSTIYMTRAVILAGNGGSYYFPGTILNFPPGVTGIKLTGTYSNPWSPDNYGAPWGQIENIHIKATGKDSTTTTGNYTAGASTITLASAANFVNGQTIGLRGAGLSQVYQNVFGNISSGTNRLRIYGSGGTTQQANHAIPDGTVVALSGGALPVGTYAVSHDVYGTVTLSANATGNATGAAVTVYNDLYADIVSGGGTTTLTIDNLNNGGTSVTGATVFHADAGINAKTTWQSNGFVSVEGFAGAGIYMRCSHGDNPMSNCNVSRIGMGVLNNNRLGMLMSGEDSNASSVIGMYSIANSQWDFLDESLLGNTYLGLHASGGYGYKTTGGVNKSVFLGTYTEGGTANLFDSSTQMIGRDAQPMWGGNNIGSTDHSAVFGNYYLSNLLPYPNQALCKRMLGTGPSSASLNACAVVENSAPSASNPAWGWIKITSGTGTTIGTDWLVIPALKASPAAPTGVTSTTTAGSTTNVFTNTTWTGGTGSTAYTVGDIIKALKLQGLLVN